MPDGPRGPLTPSGPPLGGDRDIAYRKPRSWFRKNLSGLLAAGLVVLVVAGITAAVLATRNIDDVSASADPSGLASSLAPSPSPSTAPPALVKPPTPSGPTRTTATGTVVAVVASGKWTVSVQKGLVLTVTATPTTKYEHNKKVDDIKKNSSITVVGTIANGVITATSITIEKKKS